MKHKKKKKYGAITRINAIAPWSPLDLAGSYPYFWGSLLSFHVLVSSNN